MASLANPWIDVASSMERLLLVLRVVALQSIGAAADGHADAEVACAGDEARSTEHSPEEQGQEPQATGTEGANSPGQEQMQGMQLVGQEIVPASQALVLKGSGKSGKKEKGRDSSTGTPKDATAQPLSSASEIQGESG